MDPDLSDYPQTSSQHYKIQLIPLPQMQNMYVQSATYDIHSPSCNYSLHHLTRESFYRHASQELCKQVEPEQAPVYSLYPLLGLHSHPFERTWGSSYFQLLGLELLM